VRGALGDKKEQAEDSWGEERDKAWRVINPKAPQDLRSPNK
jgi:hypothetical protein